METVELLLTSLAEIAKLLLSFIADVIHYIAWPAVALIILLVFRKELGDLTGRFSEYEGRHGIFRFSKTNKPASPQLPEDTRIPPSFTPEAKKILATLWDRQMYHFKDNPNRRWSFRVLPNADEYGIFTVGFAELILSGLVGWTTKDGQALLTEKGLEYLEGHPDIQAFDRYKF